MKIGDIMEWKFIKRLEDVNEIKEFEIQKGCKLPRDLRLCIIANNGGRPERKVFDTAVSKGRMIKKLLSLNYDDVENIWDAYNVMQQENKKLVPFASDPGGNFICFNKDSGEIYLWLHETNTAEYVAESFKDFLDKLE